MNYIERNRDFKGVWIPKEIWLNEELTMTEKVILTEIDSLDNEEHCVAGNEYLAQFCQCSEWKVSTAIKKLIELGYLEVVSFDGRHRRLRSCLWKFYTQPLEIPNSDLGKPKAINIDNNINNNIDIIYNVETSSTDSSKSSKNEFIEQITEIIDYLNTKANTNYRTSTERTQKLIVAKLKQDFTVDDFKHVIDVKCADWLNNPEFEKFLRPETLFGNKFESYLNSKVSKPTPVYKTPATPEKSPSTPPAKAEAYTPTIEEMRAVAASMTPYTNNIFY